MKQEQSANADAGGTSEPYQHEQSATGAVKREDPFSSVPGTVPVKSETEIGMDVDDEGMPPQVLNLNPSSLQRLLS